MSEVKEKSTVKQETIGLDTNAKERIAGIKTVAVIGAGTMGNGITHVFAQMGCNVHMVDISREALDKAVAKIGSNMDRQVAKNVITEDVRQAALDNIKTYTDMAEAVADADLVVEAASENIDLKIKIFQELDRLCPAKTILASNTSSISITRIGSFTK